MEGERFDRWARGCAARVSRRGLSALIAGAVTSSTIANSDAKKKKKKKKKPGNPVAEDCPGGCPNRKFCFATGCLCNGGFIDCGDTCCAPEVEACLADGTCCIRESDAETCRDKQGMQVNNCEQVIDCDAFHGNDL